jgi:PAS domain S-box-containing protein
MAAPDHARPNAASSTIAGETVHSYDEGFAAIAEAAFDAIITTNPAGLIIGWNPSAERIFGYHAEEVVGHEIALILPARHLAMYQSALRDIRYSRSSRILGQVFEISALRKDGKEFPVELTLTHWSGTHGPSFTAIIRDVSERKQCETALQESEERFRQLAETIGDVFWLIDPIENRVLYVSSAFERVWSRPQSMAFQFPRIWIDSTYPEDRQAVKELFAAAARGEIREREYRIVLPSGAIRWLRTAGFPIRDDQGSVYRIAALVSDITSRKQLEEQLRQSQKLEAVGRLAGGIAHDFNNLLTVINGFADLVLRDLPPDSSMREWIEEIGRSGQRAAGLTQQLLAFGRKQMVAPVILDLNTVLADMHKMLSRLIGEHVEMNFHPADGLGYVLADRGQIEQVVVNLVVNARDAMPSGGRISIETTNTGQVGKDTGTAGAYVRLAVRDTGTGMTPEVKARIFEPFFSTKKIGQGAGLGLATVYAIVQQSNGHIEVESEPGRGTTISVYFPRRVAELHVPPVELPVPPGKKETIVVAEDEESVRRLTIAALRSGGYTVLEATDALDVIRVVENHPRQLDLLVTDVIMPDMSGRALVERLAQTCQPRAVLFMSGYTDDEVLRHGVKDSSFDFLQKPFKPDTLLHKVRAILDRKPAARAAVPEPFVTTCLEHAGP